MISERIGYIFIKRYSFCYLYNLLSRYHENETDYLFSVEKLISDALRIHYTCGVLISCKRFRKNLILSYSSSYFLAVSLASYYYDNSNPVQLRSAYGLTVINYNLILSQ